MNPATLIQELYNYVTLHGSDDLSGSPARKRACGSDKSRLILRDAGPKAL